MCKEMTCHCITTKDLDDTYTVCTSDIIYVTLFQNSGFVTQIGCLKNHNEL